MNGARNGRWIGWLALPAFLALIALVGTAVSTEAADDFRAREDRPDVSGDPGDLGGEPRADRAAPVEPDLATAPDPEPGGDLGEPDPSGTPGEGEGDTTEVTIAAADGEVVVVVDGEGRPIRLVPVDGEAIDVDPDDLWAIRLGDDGSLELIRPDEIQPGDTLLEPADGGFDLVRPDGGRVEFRADGEHDGITATEILPDGTEVELTPAPDGSVTLEDGTVVGPIDAAEDGGAIERLLDTTSDLPWPWLVAGLVLLAALSIGTAVHLHRNRPRDDIDLDALVAPGASEGRTDAFLRSLAEDPDPDRAIRLAFAAAERGLGGLPPRRADETPFEWQRRVESLRPELGPAVEPICDLFARARFGPGPAGEADRRAMVEALHRLIHGADRDRPDSPLSAV